MKKLTLTKLASIVTSAVMLTSSAALTVSAAQTFEPSEAAAPAESGETLDSYGFTIELYSIWGEDVATITGFKQGYYADRVNKEYNENHTISFPSEATDNNGKVHTVTSINIKESGWADGKDQNTFTRVNIPKSVQTINETFRDMPNLEVVSFEEGSVCNGRWIEHTFYGCENLKRVGIGETDALPDTWKYMGEYSFYNCKALKSITLPEEMDEIDEGVFKGCTSLTSFEWPDNFKIIDKDSFKGCTSLKTVIIPETIQEIDQGAFLGCTSLTDVQFRVHRSKNKDTYGKNDLKGIWGSDSTTGLSWDRGGAFEGCTSLTHIDIPQSTNNLVIDYYSFRDSGLVGIDLPSQCSEIRAHAFMGTKIDQNGMKTDGGDAYGVGIFNKTVKIDELAFEDLKPTIASFEGSNADTYTYEHKLPFISIGQWTPFKITYRGDLDGDGDITSNDALNILRLSLEPDTLTQEQKDLCDLDDDGDITANDALIVLRMGVGLD